MGKLSVHLYTYLSDNYGVLLHDAESGSTACIDTGEAAATLAAIKATGWTLNEIWVTHHHADHTAGVLAVKDATGAKVIGPNPVSSPIEGLDQTLSDGDTFEFGGSTVQVLHTPGHTLDMINFYLPNEKLVFTGDTLFTLGCGRLFEGTPAQMFQSLSKLSALPKDTVVYSSHEYTVANAKFALSVDPDNQNLINKAESATKAVANGEPTVPSTIEEELKTNPFLRADDAGIRKVLNMQDASDEAVFTEIRHRKDNF